MCDDIPEQFANEYGLGHSNYDGQGKPIEDDVFDWDEIPEITPNEALSEPSDEDQLVQEYSSLNSDTGDSSEESESEESEVETHEQEVRVGHTAIVMSAQEDKQEAGNIDLMSDGEAHGEELVDQQSEIEYSAQEAPTSSISWAPLKQIVIRIPPRPLLPSTSSSSYDSSRTDVVDDGCDDGYDSPTAPPTKRQRTSQENISPSAGRRRLPPWVLDRLLRTSHPAVCPVGECETRLHGNRSTAMSKHLSEHLGSLNKPGRVLCPWPECTEYPSRRTLVRHIRSDHLDCHWACLAASATGCRTRLTRTDQIRVHLKRDHPDHLSILHAAYNEPRPRGYKLR